MPNVPSRLSQMVEKHFAEPDRAPALEILASYAERFAWLKDLERVRIDMVLVAKGDLEKLAREAETDWRDIIMEAEYELRDGKIVRRASLD